MGETYPRFTPLFLNSEEQLEEADDTNNSCAWQVYIPEEVELHILSYVDLKELLKYSLVCRKWNNLIKSYTLWSTIYRTKYNRKAKKLPWYLYYCLLSTNYLDTNLLVNGNGQDGCNNWKIKENGGDKFVIEDPPAGQTDYLWMYQNSITQQVVLLHHMKLAASYKPHIYVSDWTAGRFDYACRYRLQCGLRSNASDVSITSLCVEHRVAQWEGHEWKKIEITIENYPKGVKEIIFEHAGSSAGSNRQFCPGHYGSKMAGGVVKLLFDSLEPLPIDKLGNEIPKQISKVQFKTNAKVVNKPMETLESCFIS